MNDTKLENYTSFDDIAEGLYLSDLADTTAYDTTDDDILHESLELPIELDDPIGWDWLIFG